MYFSTINGLEETRFVFIHHNQLIERFQALENNEIFTVAETGFGSGLNFLCAWKAWQDHAPSSARLHFVSVEKFPLHRSDLTRALSLWPELEPLAKDLIKQYPPIDARGFHRLTFANNISLTLIYDDAAQGLNQLLPIDNVGTKLNASGYAWSEGEPFKGLIDAWFLDGFAPSKNPSMWSPELFQTIAQLSTKNKTTFATFTAAGLVRRGLQDVGFTIGKTPGFGKKREMIKGLFSDKITQQTAADTTRRNKASPSWHLCSPSAESQQQKVKHIAVIGAGLAGCQTAFSLARRGFQVTVVEQDRPGGGASGNPQGILYSKLSQSQGIFTDFNLTAYIFACHFYQREDLFDRVGDLCGVLQLAETKIHAEKYRAIAKIYEGSPELVHWLNATAATRQTGVELEHGGLFFPQTGWLRPRELCKELLKHTDIRLVEATSVNTIVQAENEWSLLSASGASILSADAVVIACANSAQHFTQCRLLPTKAIRGQISNIAATIESQALSSVLCGSGYIGPALEQKHFVGATFDLKSSSNILSQKDHALNLENTYKMSPNFSSLHAPPLDQGRVSFRCSTPDYLPIVGPVANEAIMLQRFSAYRNNFKSVVDAPGEYWPNLYLNIGHGSKGLCYTPICAELLGSMISGEPLPLPRDLVTHIHPARFLMRDLARNKL